MDGSHHAPLNETPPLEKSPPATPSSSPELPTTAPDGETTEGAAHSASELTNEPSASAEPADLEQASQPYIGLWNQLVSTTNWEKGRIIHQWREALQAAGLPASEYSDEAWSRRVGGVTGQHVGRLRRVYQRFGQSGQKYQGLYWSHFQASLDWEDAEMWLEGAVQNRWSVSRMRQERWQVVDGNETNQPRDEDVIANELDEDFEPALGEQPAERTFRDTGEPIEGPPIPEGPDFGDEEDAGDSRDLSDRDSNSAAAAVYSEDQPAEETVELVRPFEKLSELPDDLAEAFEAFKLALLRHKSEHWQQISCDEVLASLDALKTLALAPSGEEPS